MELKKYVLTTDGYIYKKEQVKQHKDTDTTHIVSFGIVSYHLINIKKTSDNILDLVEVGDLVDSGDGIVEFLGTFKDDVWIVSMNETVKKRTVKTIYKRQTNGDYVRYVVEGDL